MRRHKMLDVRGNMDRLDRFERKPSFLAPCRELGDRDEVRLPRVPVPDIRGEELTKTPPGVSASKNTFGTLAFPTPIASWRSEAGVRSSCVVRVKSRIALRARRLSLRELVGVNKIGGVNLKQVVRNDLSLVELPLFLFRHVWVMFLLHKLIHDKVLYDTSGRGAVKERLLDSKRNVNGSYAHHGRTTLSRKAATG